MEKETKKRSLVGLPKHSVNPFIADLELNQNITACMKKEETDRQFLDLDTGEVRTLSVDSGEISYFWKDAEPFVKLFKSDSLQAVQNLNTPALRIFIYIAQNLQVNKDMIIIPFTKYCEISKTVSRTSYYDGIRELVELKIIAMSEIIGLYHVNPNVLYNGKREKLLGPASTYYMKSLSYKIPSKTV